MNLPHNLRFCVRPVFRKKKPQSFAWK